MKAWEIFLHPAKPTPLNALEFLIYLGGVVVYFRFRKQLLLGEQLQTVLSAVFFCSGPLLIAAILGVLHAWAIFSFSDHGRENLILTAFNASYNLVAATAASLANIAITYLVLRRRPFFGPQ